MIPGELRVADGDIEINQGRDTVTVKVANTGDRPVQIGSHYHFYEVIREAQGAGRGWVCQADITRDSN